MSRWQKLSGVLLLSVATFFLLTNVEQFVPVGDQLVKDPSFRDGIQHWQVQGAGEVFHGAGFAELKNPGSGTYIAYQTIPVDEPGYYRVSFVAKAENIALSSGAGSWAGAGVLLRYVKDQEVRKYGSPTIVPNGIVDEEYYQADSHVRADVHSLDVVMWIKEASGQFFVKNITLHRLDETDPYTFLKWTVSVVWLLTGAWLVANILPVLSFYNFIGFVLLCGIAFVGALMPEAFLSTIFEKVSTMLTHLLQSIAMASNQKVIGVKTGQGESNEIISTAGHFLVFAGIGLLAGLNSKKFGLLFLVASSFVFALSTEVLQLLVVRRTASLSDLIVDVTGLISGLVLGVWCLRLCGKFIR